jgi:hypothetical protein
LHPLLLLRPKPLRLPRRLRIPPRPRVAPRPSLIALTNAIRDEADMGLEIQKLIEQLADCDQLLGADIRN